MFVNNDCTGPIGNRGRRGIRGPTGPTGPAGPTGITGPSSEVKAEDFDIVSSLGYNFYQFGKYMRKLVGEGPEICFDIAMSVSGRYVLIPSSNGLWLSSNFGRTMTNIDSKFPDNMRWATCTMSFTGQFMMVSANTGKGDEEGGVFFSDNYGDSWSYLSIHTQFSAFMKFEAIAMTPNAEVVVSLANNADAVRMYYSVENGVENGTYIVTPDQKFNGLPRRSEYSSIMWGGVEFSDNGMIGILAVRALVPLGSKIPEPGCIYITTDSGIYWRKIPATEDYGINWSSVSISGSGKTMIAGTSGVGAYISTNFGDTWTLIDTSSIPENYVITDSAINATGQYMAVVANGLFCHTNDFGATWTTELNSFNGYFKVAMSSSSQVLTIALHNGVLVNNEPTLVGNLQLINLTDKNATVFQIDGGINFVYVYGEPSSSILNNLDSKGKPFFRLDLPGDNQYSIGQILFVKNAIAPDYEVSIEIYNPISTNNIANVFTDQTKTFVGSYGNGFV